MSDDDEFKGAARAKIDHLEKRVEAIEDTSAKQKDVDELSARLSKFDRMILYIGGGIIVYLAQPIIEQLNRLGLK